jgi:hypothetical protein
MQVIEFYAEFAKVTGSIPAAVFLTHALRCQRRFGGWFPKTIAEWEKATTLSREQQDLARQKLRSLGVLREVRKGLPPKVWYWVDEDRLNQMLNDILKAENPATNSETRSAGKPQINLRKRRKQICGKHTNKSVGNTQINLRENHKQNCGKATNLTTTVVDTNNINVIDHTNNVISCNRDYVDHVVGSSSYFQDSSFYKEELCLLNSHAERSSAVCAGQGQTIFCKNDGKGQKQTDLVLSAGSSTGDKESDASRTPIPAHHSLTVDSTTAENEGAAMMLGRAGLQGSGNDAKTEGAGTLNSENAQESFIGDFLVRDIPNIVTDQENAPERLETALKRKSSGAGKAENGREAEIVPESDGLTDAQESSVMHFSAPDAHEVVSARDCVPDGLKTASKRGVKKTEIPKKRQKTETPEEREFREGFFGFATKAVDWIVSKGGVREDPSHFWAWAKRLRQRDKRITIDTLKQCFRHYAASTDGTWWRSNTKTLRQFVSAFEDIYQSYQQSYPHVVQTNQFNQLNQKGDNHALYSANHEFHKREKYWQQWFQTACQSGLPKTRET